MSKVESGIAVFILSNLIVGLILSFHDTLWPWAAIPAGILWALIVIGFEMSRRNI